MSLGTNSFRSRIVHHSLHPEWNERIVWYERVVQRVTISERSTWETVRGRVHRVVRQSTLNFLVKFSVYDYDALTANDLVATTAIKLSELVTPTTQTNRALPLQLTKQVCPAEELGRHAAGAGI